MVVLKTVQYVLFSPFLSIYAISAHGSALSFFPLGGQTPGGEAKAVRAPPLLLPNLDLYADDLTSFTSTCCTENLEADNSNNSLL